MTLVELPLILLMLFAATTVLAAFIVDWRLR